MYVGNPFKMLATCTMHNFWWAFKKNKHIPDYYNAKYWVRNGSLEDREGINMNKKKEKEKVPNGCARIITRRNELLQGGKVFPKNVGKR